MSDEIFSSLVISADHWRKAARADLEREVIDRVTRPLAVLNAPTGVYYWLDRPGEFWRRWRVVIEGVRKYNRYYPPSRPGWTPLHKSRLVRRPRTWIEVQWRAVPVAEFRQKAGTK